MKRFLGILTVLVMLVTCCSGASALAEPPVKAALTISGIQALNGGNAVIDARDGRVTFIGGTCASEKVKGPEDAARVVEDMIPLMGGGSRTHFEPWRTLSDSFGNTYYVFQQVYADMVVLGGAVKVVTDRNGTMLGLTCSLVSDLPDTDASEGITAEKAEQVVLQHEKEQKGSAPALIEGATKKIVLPVDRELDLEADDILTRFVWIVCTTNPSGSIASDMPYLAHYVTLSGEYLYSLPTLLPGDRAANAGYDAEYLFRNMEPVSYTGYVDLSDGTEKEITVTVMRDSTTGTFFLGDPERRIIVADCWEFLYNHGNIVPETSPDNREWDQVSLLSLYNYSRAYDYYKVLGWQGGDGENTPIVILKDFCDQDYKPINNAAYAGRFYGCQCFLSSSANDFAQCLDIIAHEFTHCVTGSVMTYNVYKNDFGAINEAMSDIQGNICEMLAGDTEDLTWIIGDHSTESIRSMSDPHMGRQPRYTWDLYYQSAVMNPTEVNDRGGVHANSSLLNRVGYLLWEGGMTLEEARAFWFAVDCAMVPGSDFGQLKVLLPWMLKITGLGRLQDTLTHAVRETRLGESRMPAGLPEDQTLLTLDLPDNENFNDGKWMLTVLSINTEAVSKVSAAFLEDMRNGKTEGYPKMLIDMAGGTLPAESDPQAGDSSLLQILTETLLSGGLQESTPAAPEKAEPASAEQKELADWVRENFRGCFYFGNGSAGQDGHTVSMMTLAGRAVPVLIYLDVMPNSEQVRKANAAVWLFGRWIDVTPVLAPVMNAEKPDVAASLKEFLKTGLVFDLLEAVLSGEGVRGLLRSMTCELPAGRVFSLPADGLGNLDFSANMAIPDMTDTVTVNNRMSRPKE